MTQNTQNNDKKRKGRRIMGMPQGMFVILAIFVAVGFYIQKEAAALMFTQADYWAEVKERFRRDSLSLPASRGNILSCDGRVMVASLPEYRIALDFIIMDKDSAQRVKAQHYRDSMLTVKLDSISQGLAEIFPEHTADYFRKRIKEGRKRRSHSWRLYQRATYLQMKAVQELPLFREGVRKSGLLCEPNAQRKKIYGSLAARTLGDMHAEDKTPKTGLELIYDTLLRGKDGYYHRERVRNRNLEFTDQEPQHGHDLVSTIDIRMQDIAEKALKDKLMELDGTKIGVAIVMEVATGDIKAMTSLTRVPAATPRGYDFREVQNHAVNALWEPGSTFKTGSMMVAMEDGYITPETVVDCEHGVKKMYGRNMTDHNRHKGGYGDLTVTQILGQSSNIGVSKVIDQYYHDQPEKYVQGLYDLGVGIPLGIPMGANPRVRMPKKVGRQYTNWSKTALAWMSIGCETAIPPKSALTFYNAIANGGKMVRPRFVKAEMADGQLVREFPVEVIKESICSPKTLANIQDILEKVVSEGLGKKAGNKKFRVSGKTGTAQVAENGSYAGRNYMVSFCGYYPSEAPKYSCIVCIYEHTAFPSGGGHAGPVFRRISQLVMNDGEGRQPKAAGDSTSVFQPTVLAGDMQETRALMRQMDIAWKEAEVTPMAWGSIRMDSIAGQPLIVESTTPSDAAQIPDVTGMGAKDIVTAMQRAGQNVRLQGQGKAYKQSVAAGTIAKAGHSVTVFLR